MRLSALITTLCFTFALAACQSQPPTTPPADSGNPGDDQGDLSSIPLIPTAPGDEEGLPLLPEDGVDEGMRGLTALLTGDVGLNGASVTPPGYVASPASVAQAATIGQIALIRLRATASDATTTRTLYSDVRGPGGAYSSMTFLSNDTSEYKAVYVERNEDLSVRVHNRPSYSGALNPPAADVNYTYETKAIEDSSEPNDDENPATVTDRLTGGALGLGSAIATRSFYEYSASARDKEDWFSTTLTEGARYRYRLTSYNPRYGTWGYTLKLYNAAGTQVGTTTTIATGYAAGNLVTPAIPATGLYYIQIVGTPVTKSNNSNVFYSLYGINVCQLAVPELLAFVQQSSLDRCVGTTGTWNVAVSPAATSYAWNFGAGMNPPTSTQETPTCTIAARGTYIGSLTTTSSCGASFTSSFTYTVGCNWVRTLGTPSSREANDPVISLTDVVVDTQNRAHIVGHFTGTDEQVTVQEPVGSQVLLTPTGSHAAIYILLDRKGKLIRTSKIIEGLAFPTSIALTSDDDLRVVGNFTGTGVDFDPGPGTLLFDSPTTMDGFCQAISKEGELQWAVEYGGTSHEYAEGLMLSSTDAVNIVGSFYQTADFDPGAGTQSRTSAGDLDGYWLVLTDTGIFSFIGTFGGTGADAAGSIIRDSSTGYYITGAFSGTCDLNLNGTTNKTSAGGYDAFCMKYNALPVMQWAQTWGSTGLDYAGPAVIAAGGLRVIGGFRGTVDFDPGAGVVTRSSNTPTFNDAYLLGLTTSAGDYQWVSAWGGAENDTAEDLALNATNGNLSVAGTYKSTVDFDPGAGTASRTAVGGPDMYLNVLSSTGSYVNVSTWGSASGSEYLSGIATTSNGWLFAVGEFSSALDFNPGAGTSTINPRGVTDSFTMRLAADATY